MNENIFCTKKQLTSPIIDEISTKCSLFIYEKHPKASKKAHLIFSIAHGTEIIC